MDSQDAEKSACKAHYIHRKMCGASFPVEGCGSRTQNMQCASINPIRCFILLIFFNVAAHLRDVQDPANLTEGIQDPAGKIDLEQRSLEPFPEQAAENTKFGVTKPARKAAAKILCPRTDGRHALPSKEAAAPKRLHASFLTATKLTLLDPSACPAVCETSRRAAGQAERSC